MKKILFVVEAFGGGIFTYIVELTNALTDNYEVYIAYSCKSQTPEDYPDYFDPRVHLIPVRHFVRCKNPLEHIRAIAELRRIAGEIGPDIIHLHSSIAGALGRIAFAGGRVPLFYTPHGYYFLTERGRSARRFVYWLAEYLGARGRCATISCSLGEHQETLKLTKKATYINNGIDTEKLGGLEPLEREQRPFTVFTLGRICCQKRPALFNQIAEALPELKFVWIGEGELRSELTAPNIEVTGWVERQKALAYAVQGDVFLLTSLWEGLSMSLLEAMYLRKPCVVSDCTGNRDVIRDGQNGFLCRSRDAFVDAICRARDGDMQPIMDAAFRDVAEHYSISVMAEQYRRIYERGI